MRDTPLMAQASICSRLQTATPQVFKVRFSLLRTYVPAVSLREGEDWAAFEGMGYTKTDDTALGSRGQGKAAFLYHSDQMMMLYDTLLENGEYRLGVRRAIPSDTVLNPPFVGEEARRVVSTRYAVPDGTDIQLGLEPLASRGTRVIIPHLSANAVDAIHSGELYQWLQRCWWRAVQVGLTIDVVDEYGSSQRGDCPLVVGDRTVERLDSRSGRPREHTPRRQLDHQAHRAALRRIPR